MLRTDTSTVQLERPALLVAQLLSIGALLFALAGDALAGVGVENGDRWPSRTIRYSICDCSLGEVKPLCAKVQCIRDAQAVRDAISLWNQRAGHVVRLVERDKTDRENPYLLYVSQVSETTKATEAADTWCFTEDVGYHRENGPKLVIIGDRCVEKKKAQSSLLGTIAHETGHAVGLHHEQQRTDRDKYLSVKFTGSTANSAIYQSGRVCASDAEEKCEFQSVLFGRLYSYGQDLSDYDFGSVMHYPLEPDASKWKELCEPGSSDDLKTACMALTKEGSERLKAQGLTSRHIGQRTGLSDLDIKALDQLYSGTSF